MSTDSQKPESRQVPTKAKGCEFDSLLGRNAFKYFLTDIVCDICKNGTTVNFIDTFDALYESFDYEKCYKHLLSTGGVCGLIPTAQMHQSNYRPMLFTYLGSIRRQERGRGLKELLVTLANYVMDDPEQREPKFIVDHSIRRCQADELADSWTNTTSSPTFDRPVAASSSTPASTTTSPATASPAVTSTPLPVSLSKTRDHINDAEDIATYTTLLKELGDEDSELVTYKEERLRFEPPLWKCTVNFGEVQGVGEGPKKRTAKHKASKAAWLQLG